MFPPQFSSSTARIPFLVAWARSAVTPSAFEIGRSPASYPRLGYTLSACVSQVDPMAFISLGLVG